MCGLAGLMARDGAPADPGVVESMLAHLGHRGREGSHVRLEADVALGHARLAIIDLMTGEQPMVAEDGCAIAVNGEIYNYVELRRQLVEGGQRFTSTSDSEPALHLYRRLGLPFLDRLRGMYAIALHDPGSRRLVLARDPFGIKPLYYAETPAGFAFASEPRALLRSGLVSPVERAGALAELMELQFTTGAETIFAGIHRVLPGECLVVERGTIVERHRRAALPEAPTADMDDAIALATFDKVFEDSVRVHQRSDVPYGMFLSGGVDSSLVLAFMKRLNQRPVHAFTAHFPDTPAADETAIAAAVAKRNGAVHHVTPFTGEDFLSLLPAVVEAFDDPTADYAVLPTFKLAASLGGQFKVILSGEGGDELFGGYGRYRTAMGSALKGPRPPFRKGKLAGLGLWRQAPEDWRAGIAAAEAAVERPGRSRMQKAQALDCADWLPHDLLLKLDRCLMAHTVEGRTPFLDPRLAAFAFPLADRHKVRRHGVKARGKWLLRSWLANAMPEAEPFRAKQGFTVPVGSYLSAHAETLGPLLAADEAIAAAFNHEAVRALFAGPLDGERAMAGWLVLFYALWHRRHFRNVPAQGTALDMLSAPA